jgi:hypothetical protein
MQLNPIVELIRLEEHERYGTLGILRVNKRVYCATLEPQTNLMQATYQASLLSSILVVHGLRLGILKPGKSVTFLAALQFYFMLEILKKTQRDVYCWDEITPFCQSIIEEWSTLEIPFKDFL